MAKSDWVRFEMSPCSYFVQRSNINTVCINKNHPNEIVLTMTGDDPDCCGTAFTFNSVEERNQKLNEIFSEEREKTNVNDSECGSPPNEA